MSALEGRIDEHMNDSFLLRQIGNSLYDHLSSMRRFKPSPKDYASEADSHNTMPDIFGIDYNKKPY